MDQKQKKVGERGDVRKPVVIKGGERVARTVKEKIRPTKEGGAIRSLKQAICLGRTKGGMCAGKSRGIWSRWREGSKSEDSQLVEHSINIQRGDTGSRKD